MQKIIDISPVLAETTAVWPGDTPLQRNVQLRLEDGASVALASLATSVHIGAHADAPCHYARNAESMDEVGLEPYIGPCYVVNCRHATALVTIDDCRAAVAAGHQRLLFKTGSYPDSKVFNEAFVAFAPEAVEFMGKAGVKLIGIDTPSVDPFHSKTMDAHHMLHRFGMRNLEGLDLASVSAGSYELVALPLKLAGFDGSPVRAILRELAPNA